jgi:thioredoxin 1
MAGKTFVVTSDNFETEVLGSEKPVLVDFWAEWCGPCRMIAPIVDQLSTEYDGKMRVGKLDADAFPEILQRYGIMGIPTLILFKRGQPVERIVGFQPKEQLEGKIKRHFN